MAEAFKSKNKSPFHKRQVRRIGQLTQVCMLCQSQEAGMFSVRFHWLSICICICGLIELNLIEREFVIPFSPQRAVFKKLQQRGTCDNYSHDIVTNGGEKHLSHSWAGNNELILFNVTSRFFTKEMFHSLVIFWHFEDCHFSKTYGGTLCLEQLADPVSKAAYIHFPADALVYYHQRISGIELSCKNYID